ncbi:MAG TPA: hypothetical protein VNJ08_14655 [Bacteriovoracaceae bacterium]|nr:hypothetical protein [Bacteriovoracaceae bacterium]
MKILTLVLATCLFFLARTFAQSDYRANYCEVFIPEVTKTTGPFGAKVLLFHIKTLNDRLDSGIKEVGFLYKSLIKAKDGSAFEQHLTERAIQTNDNRFIVFLPVSHDDAQIEYEGNFYVRTKNNTTYWLNPREGRDFYLNQNTYNQLDSSLFNPSRCH